MIAIVRRCSLRDRQGREVANAGRPFDDRCHHRGPTGVQLPSPPDRSFSTTYKLRVSLVETKVGTRPPTSAVDREIVSGVQFPPECGSTTAGAMAVAAREGESIWVRMEHDRTDQDQWKDCREVSREISE